MLKDRPQASISKYELEIVEVLVVEASKINIDICHVGYDSTTGFK